MRRGTVRRDERWGGGGPEERPLGRDETARITPPSGGVELRALEGCLLVTQTGDPEDHVLEPGVALRLPGGGLVVAWALATSRLEIRAATGQAPRTARATLAAGFR